MDFFNIREAATKNGTTEVFPDFLIKRSKDLMIRGGKFYAIWDAKAGLWSTDEFDVQRLVDEELWNYRNELAQRVEGSIKVKTLGNWDSKSWLQFRNYVSHLPDSYHELDESLTFQNTEIKKEDYVSKRLPYSLIEGDLSAWNEIVDTLYRPEERQKIEWIFGALISGDSKHIQKFGVFYGPPGAGKGTILNISMWLTEGYNTTFVAKELTGASNAFALESFKTNPILGVDPDGDLSKIQDNTKLNSLVSHEYMQINEKHKAVYTARFNTFLLIGSNDPVKISNGKSGLIRRLIDIQPSGDLLSPRKYQTLIAQVKFELGAIAYHCLNVYRSLGKDFYAAYRPVEMMLQTDVFFNYIEAYYDIFKAQDGTTLVQAYNLYKEYCEETRVDHVMPRYKFRDELRNYFKSFEERAEVDGVRVRSWYSIFNADHFKSPVEKQEDAAVPGVFSLVMDDEESLFDKLMSDMPAQYSKANGAPEKWWTNAPQMRNGKEYIPKPNEICSTTLSQLDSTKEHYVKVPENHIVIDFDLTDADGNKSAERNLEAASIWPSTYAEYSKSGEGIHLHYNYIGDASELIRLYDDGIEVKVYTGNSSLRRRLTRCNNVPVADMHPGYLPIKEKKDVIDSKTIQSEQSLRKQIERNLHKEIHPGTKSSVDFIKKILDDAYEQGLVYDVTDLRNRILAFANGSTNQAMAAIKAVQQMKFKSEVSPEEAGIEKPSVAMDDAGHAKECDCDDCKNYQGEIAFFDVEVFPNLFVICWKYRGAPNVVRMINPTAQEVEEIITMLKLVGFNCRRYDNHVMYAAAMGYNNEQLYKVSKKLIEGSRNAYFGEAYNMSYTDIYDFTSKKQSLKKYEIELGIHHMELGLDWGQPVPPELWEKVADYCANDVIATEATFEDRYQDFVARQILASLSGLSVNATTQQHTARIVFGNDKRPQEKFKYTHLKEQFPGYEFGVHQKELPNGKVVNVFESTYKGEITGEGGYVYAEPGIYENVALLDVASMHPTSIEALNLFGDEYTKNFSDLKAARIAIKRRDWEAFSKVLDGKLTTFVNEDAFLSDTKEAKDQLEALSYALKIVINIVYGLTSAKFDNAFRDPQNIDNIVAKRGALFMIELKGEVQARGFTVAHIKTDSIKIPNATKAIIDFVFEFGKRYGYDFEHEATYSKMALVNEAVYVAKVGWATKASKIGTWEAVGAQFQHPYVYKKLFSKEKVENRDFCETKQVKVGSMFLNFEGVDTPIALEKGDQRQFIGRTGMFVPIKEEAGGAILEVQRDEGKFHAVTGTTGYHWLEKEMVDEFDKWDDVDFGYFEGLVNKAIMKINEFGDFDWFIEA